VPECPQEKCSTNLVMHTIWVSKGQAMNSTATNQERKEPWPVEQKTQSYLRIHRNHRSTLYDGTQCFVIFVIISGTDCNNKGWFHQYGIELKLIPPL
jgi:hypothetical protein